MNEPEDKQAARVKSGRKLWIWLTVGLLTLGALYSAFWLVIASLAGERIGVWAQGMRQAGYTIHWETMVVSGYPFRLVARLDNPQAEGLPVGSDQQWAWETDAITVSGRPWQWSRFLVEAPGRHTLTVSNRGEAPARTIVTNAVALDIDTDWRGNMWRRITVAASDLSVESEGRIVSQVDQLTCELGRETPNHADEQIRTGSVRLDVRNIDIPVLDVNLVRTVGSLIRHVFLNVEVYGPLPNGLTEPAIAVWREAGGVVEVRRALVDYGPLGLDGEGTMALDGHLQPVGSFMARLEGFSETVDILRGSGMITDGNALTAKLVLGALAKKDAATGKSQLSIPLMLQDQTLYAGPLAITKFPRIHW